MSTPPQIGVVVVDDHRMFADSLAALLSAEPDIVIHGVATGPAQALRVIAEHRPQVVLLDHHMPDGDGTTLTAQIKQRYPQIMVVMLTGSADDRVLLGAIEAGCSGFLTKDRAATEVAEAVRTAAQGDALITPAMLARLLPRLSRTHRSLGSDLTAREREVLELMAHGRSNRDIGAHLHLSVNTVRNYVQAILVKLDAHSKLEAVSTAVREGVIEYGPAR